MSPAALFLPDSAFPIQLFNCGVNGEIVEVGFVGFNGVDGFLGAAFGGPAFGAGDSKEDTGNRSGGCAEVGELEFVEGIEGGVAETPA